MEGEITLTIETSEPLTVRDLEVVAQGFGAGKSFAGIQITNAVLGIPKAEVIMRYIKTFGEKNLGGVLVGHEIEITGSGEITLIEEEG